MFAFILSLWREWKEHALIKATIASSIGLAFVGGFLSFNPLAMAEYLTIFSLALGWKAGCSFKANTAARKLCVSARLRPFHGAAGTLCGVILIALAQAALIAPGIVMMVIVWGTPFAGLSTCCAIWLSSCVMASALGCLFSLAFSIDDGFIGAVCVVLWLAATGISPTLRIANPFLQVSLVVTGNHGSDTAWRCVPIFLAVSTAFYAITIPVLWSIRKGGNRK